MSCLVLFQENVLNTITPVIGIPMERTVSDIAFLRFWEIARMSAVPLIQLPYGRADVNRNRIAQTFLNYPDFTHLIMLDLDHIHPLDVVERLIRFANQCDVVGGLNFQRGFPYEACAYVKIDGEYHSIAKWEGGLIKVDAIGFGCVCIARHVLEVIPPPWFETIYTPELNFPGDDMYFSQRCAAYGFDIYCDTTLTSPHIATHTIDYDFYLKTLEGVEIMEVKNDK